MSKKHRNANRGNTAPTEPVNPAVVAAAVAAVAPEAPVSAEAPVVSDAVLESAVADAKLTEATRATYAEQPASTVDTAPAAAAEAAPTTKKKRDPKPRLTFSKPAAKIQHVLGEKLGETLILEASDAALDATALKAKQDETLKAIDGLAKKVGEKAVQLFQTIKTGGKLNEVMQRAIEVLVKEGSITSGDKGNLQTNLLSKYTLGTARSQSNQVFCLFPVLGITKKDGKGKQVANADSVILATMRTKLAL
jgi:hypothetical protein